MTGRSKKRFFSAVCAAAMLLLSVINPITPVMVRAQEESQVNQTEQPEETELCYQNIELYPNGENAEQIVTLDGLMPEGATAEAVDVSAEHEGIAAYDITITDGVSEFQPGEENPILVEITDPAIPGSGKLQLWHIKDDGERVQIPDFTAEEGKISFYAASFSIYEIVAEETEIVPGSFTKINSVSDLYQQLSEGVYISTWANQYFATNQIETNVGNNASRTGIKKSESYGTNGTPPPDPELTARNAARYYFDLVSYDSANAVIKAKIWCFDNAGRKRYVKQADTSLSFVDDADATVFSIEAVTGGGAGCFKIAGSGTSPSRYCWNQQGGNGGKAIAAYSGESDNNAKLRMWTYSPAFGQPGYLDGKTYGLMNYTGGTHGFAMMADESDNNVHNLVELVTHQTSHSESKVFFVDEDSEVTKWTFHSTDGDRYFLTAQTSGGMKYLSVSNDKLVLTDSSDEAAKFQVTHDGDKSIQLTLGGKYVTYTTNGDDQNPSSVFAMTEYNSPQTWLNFLDFSSLHEDDEIIYSAERISVSDAVDGQKIIIYTRLWDNVNKKYDIYAVGHDGSLYPCYASGGKILWLGNGNNSLEWTFTEYLNEVTKKPNFYYELFNPYSEKYIAPQLGMNQVLSDNTIGVNMPGRRRGDYYTEIVAWDQSRYSYIGLKPNASKTKLIPCSMSTSVPFYFATREPLNQSGTLHEVPTIDNNDYGITMKMFNFDYREGVNKPGLQDSTVTYEYFNGDYSNSQNLLEDYLVYSGTDDVGYPVVVSTQKSFRDMYADAEEVNHLFLESIYDSSGYFEFDSTQNFATLNGQTGGDFTVYRELGTTDEKTKPTLQHGQFFPYNTIEGGVYSTSSPNNLYNMDALISGNQNLGLLDDSDPRKYEKLHLINNPDYFFGMEMSASFIQTASGKDAWDHDIIFEFTGDDDFWFYVDGTLVLDLGGCHSAEYGRVNFRTGEIQYSLVNANNSNRTHYSTTLKDVFEEAYTNSHPQASEAEILAYLDEIFTTNEDGQYVFRDYTTHTMRVFYMERGRGASNLHMRFNISSVKPGCVVISKKVSGDDDNLLDLDFVEYPFQIYYRLRDGENGNVGEEHLLENGIGEYRVNYENSDHPVPFIKSYRPPGFSEEDVYKNVYLISPTRNAEVSLPPGTVSYRIVECAVDNTVYDSVTIDGEEVPEERIKTSQNLQQLSSYWSDVGIPGEDPHISFDNHVGDDVIKDLFITKKLLDQNNREITDDTATFSFRLSLSAVDVSTDESLVNMHKYYVLSPNHRICRFDHAAGTFCETSLEYSRENIKSIVSGNVEGLSEIDVVFVTSGFGAISGIPAGYTIVVPGLPVGSLFKITEDPKEGYGLIGYEPVMGQITEDDVQHDIPTYNRYEDNPAWNIGQVIAEENPQMKVINKRGFGLTVNKKWSDLAITTDHAPIYTAVYVDGQLLTDSVRQIKSPKNSVYYFWTSLLPGADREERTGLSGYVVKEVTLSAAEPTVADDGTVTNYGTVTPVENGSINTISATRLPENTPAGESPEKEYDYFVSYTEGVFKGSTRTDTIANNRDGGIAVRLFKWDSEVPLKGGKFLLTDSSGNTVGTYTSSAEGIVTMLYDFEPNQLYTLKQTAAPAGYIGMHKTLCFKIVGGRAILYEEDGVTPWGDSDSTDLKWANEKEGHDGFDAFIDIYNKQFNFRIEKTDSENPEILLNSAHFALYKQVNTTINGYVKSDIPMTGFEDLITDNGVVYLCGGNSSRTITPEENGSVYYLTETKAPLNYWKADEDIVFYISATGVPALLSDSYNGQLTETDDSYVYTLSVPNVKKDTNMDVLTIVKEVTGSFGNKNRDFSFTVDIAGAGEGENFVWAKNGTELSPLPRTGGTFTMKHHDRIEILLPTDVTVTVTEERSVYRTTFKLGEGEAESGYSKAFPFTEAVTLLVTNRLDGDIATGISVFGRKSAVLVVIPLASLSAVIYMKRRRKRAA